MKIRTTNNRKSCMAKESSIPVCHAQKWQHRTLALAGVLLATLSPLVAAATTIAEYSLPTSQSMPVSIVAGPDGNLWFTEYNGNKIGRMTPQGQVTEFALSGWPTWPTSSSAPNAITLAQDGNLWFAELGGRIGKITTAGNLTEYALPFGYNSGVRGIAAGPDGNIWFTEPRCPFCDPNASGQLPNDGATIGKITPAGVISEFTLPDYHAGPLGIASGPDGNLWFTEEVGKKIGRISPSGVVAEFPLPVENSFPQGITAGSDGNLWFVESRYLSGCESGDLINCIGEGREVIGRITPAGVITEFLTSSGTGDGNGVGGIVSIVEGADHAMWFTEPGHSRSRIGRITHAGVITEFDIPTHLPASYPPNFLYTTAPKGIASGPDGNVWFVEAALGFGGKVGKVDLGSIGLDSTAPTATEATITSGFTGNWYNSGQSGHGFSIEVLPGNQMLAEWFVFAPNGGQSWILAQGPISGNTAVLQAYQPVGSGGRFPPNFNPAQLKNQAWGTITFTFADCNNGQVSWRPSVAGYTSGSIAITRLTMPAGLTCQ